MKQAEQTQEKKKPFFITEYGSIHLTAWKNEQGYLSDFYFCINKIVKGKRKNFFNENDIENIKLSLLELNQNIEREKY